MEVDGSGRRWVALVDGECGWQLMEVNDGQQSVVVDGGRWSAVGAKGQWVAIDGGLRWTTTEIGEGRVVEKRVRQEIILELFFFVHKVLFELRNGFFLLLKLGGKQLQK